MMNGQKKEKEKYRMGTINISKNEISGRKGKPQ